MRLRLGCRFHPTHDWQLIQYLEDFVSGKSSRYKGLIYEDDIFGDKDPWEVFGNSKSDEKVRYFFTQVQRKTQGGCRFDRTVGKELDKDGKKVGVWHGQDRAKPVVDKNGESVIGFKRSFAYWNRGSAHSAQHGQWILNEFCLAADSAVIKEKYPMFEKRQDFVLCRLKRKKNVGNGDENQRDPKQAQSDLEAFLASALAVAQPPTEEEEEEEHGGDEIGAYFEGVPADTLTEVEDSDLISAFLELEDMMIPAEMLPESANTQPRVEENSGGGNQLGMLDMALEDMELIQSIWSCDDVTTLIDFDV